MPVGHHPSCLTSCVALVGLQLASEPPWAAALGLSLRLREQLRANLRLNFNLKLNHMTLPPVGSLSEAFSAHDSEERPPCYKEWRAPCSAACVGAPVGETASYPALRL